MMADQEIKHQFRDALRQALLEEDSLEADIKNLEAAIKKWKEWLDQETKEREERMSEETAATLEQPEWRPLTSAELAQAEEEWGAEAEVESQRTRDVAEEEERYEHD